MHWNVPPDAFPGSATLVYVLDRWLMDWLVVDMDVSTISMFLQASGFTRQKHQFVALQREKFKAKVHTGYVYL